MKLILGATVAVTMVIFGIQGGCMNGTLCVSGDASLTGKVQASGSKFSVIPLIISCLLSDSKIKILNVPRISDADVLFSALRYLGVSVCSSEDNVVLNAKLANDSDVPDYLVTKMRGTFLLLPALLVRRGHTEIARPHGCQLGPRFFSEHLRVIASFGVKLDFTNGRFTGKVKKIKPANIELGGACPSPGATKSFLMMAVGAKGTSVLHNASILPEVVDFCDFLKKSGLSICLQGTTIEVEGGPEMRTTEVIVAPDRIECLTWAIIAGYTHSKINICNGASSLSSAEIEWQTLQSVGVGIKRDNDAVLIDGTGKLLGNVKISTGAYPAFNTDAHPLFAPLLLRGSKSSVITENVFGTYRFRYLEELRKMGARFEVQDNTVRFFPSRKFNGTLLRGHDIRATASLVIAALGAKGDSTILEADHFERGYCSFVEKIRGLGGRVFYI